MITSLMTWPGQAQSCTDVTSAVAPQLSNTRHELTVAGYRISRLRYTTIPWAYPSRMRTVIHWSSALPDFDKDTIKVKA